MPTRVLAVVVLAIGTTLCPAAAQTIEDQDARPILVRSGPERGVAQRPLNVRNGPGRTHRKIAEFSRGSELVFLTPPGCYDGYCFVQGPRSVRGWVLAEAVRKQQKGDNSPRRDVVGYAISPNDLNLRAGPSRHEKNLGIVRRGTTLNLLKSPPCRNGYCFVETPHGKRGWVLRSAISVHGFQ